MYVIGCSTESEDERGALSGCLYLFNDRANGSWHWQPWTGPLVGAYRTPLPYGLSTVSRPPSVAEYGGRLYITGWGTYNMVVDEHHRCWKLGMRSPEQAPAITGAVGTGAIGYISWYDELTGERSNLSAGTTISTAMPRTWALPSRPPDDVFVSDGTVSGASPVIPSSPSVKSNYLRPGDRVGFPDLHANISYNLVHEVGGDGMFTVDGLGLTPGSSTVVALPFTRATHCELWLSVAGGLPQLVMRVPIGTTSVVESTATASLGESFIGSFERFPRCSMNAIWNDRQLMAGDPDNPDTVYMSEMFYPERWAGLSFRTRDGAPVTGILPLRDYCLIFSRDRTYMLQGYTEVDFSFNMIEQSLGAVGHRSNAVVHGSAYVWTEKGPYMYNGSWHPLSPENLFTQPAITQTTSGRARAVVDPDSNTFILVSGDIEVLDRYVSWSYGTGGLSLGSLFGTAASRALVFDYTTVQPEAGGTFATARLSIDTQDFTRGAESSVFPGPDYVYHYLTNKWGLGSLYMFHYTTELPEDLGGTPIVPQAGWETPSFYVFAFDKMTVAQGFGREGVGVPNLFATLPDFVVALGHYFFEDIGGGSNMEGKTFRRLWVDARSYTSNTVVTALPGDDDALEIYFGRQKLSGMYTMAPLKFPFTWPLHLMAVTDSGESSVGPIIKVTPDGMSGRGLSLLFVAPNLGLGASFRGFGGAYIEGPASRFGHFTVPI